MRNNLSYTPTHTTIYLQVVEVLCVRSCPVSWDLSSFWFILMIFLTLLFFHHYTYLLMIVNSLVKSPPHMTVFLYKMILIHWSFGAWIGIWLLTIPSVPLWDLVSLQRVPAKLHLSEIIVISASLLYVTCLGLIIIHGYVKWHIYIYIYC